MTNAAIQRPPAAVTPAPQPTRPSSPESDTRGAEAGNEQIVLEPRTSTSSLVPRNRVLPPRTAASAEGSRIALVDLPKVDDVVVSAGALATEHSVRPETLAAAQRWLEHEGVPRLDAARTQRLAVNLAALRRGGVVTPQAFEAWVQARHNQDFLIACAAGPLSQAGYLVGMELANHFAGQVLHGTQLSDASKLGALLGGFVGTLDVGASVASEAVAGRLQHQGGTPEGSARRGAASALLYDAAWATGMNVAKNICRTVLPFALASVQRRPDGLVSLAAANVVDVTWDGAVGMLPALLDACRKLRQGGDGAHYLEKLLLAEPAHFARQVQRTTGTAPEQAPITAKAPPSLGRRAAQLAASAVVPLAVIGMIVVHISMLVGRNTEILSSGHAGRDIPDGLADPKVLARKALSSTHQMALMTATINLIAPLLGMAIDKLMNEETRLPRPRLDWPGFLKPTLPPAPAAGDA